MQLLLQIYKNNVNGVYDNTNMSIVLGKYEEELEEKEKRIVPQTYICLEPGIIKMDLEL